MPSGRRFEILSGGQRLSFRALFALLEGDVRFVDWYTSVIAGCDVPAFFWEHPPLDTRSIDHGAEFVLIEAPALEGLDPEPGPFEPRFAQDPDADVVVFENLGGDALLIAPCPVGPPEAYPHLAAFLRLAPEAQVRSLWRHAAGALHRNLGRDPRWLSTSGLGVSWLHLRLDRSPKYYQFEPYRVGS